MQNSDQFICAALGKPFTSNYSWRKATGNHLYSSALPKSTMAHQKWQCHHGPALGQITHHHYYHHHLIKGSFLVYIESIYRIASKIAV